MKVKDLLKTKSDWTKGTYAMRDKGKWRYCLMGAVRYCYLDRERQSVENKLFDYLKLHYFDTSRGSVVLWNDDPEREFKEVKELVNVLDI